MATARLAGRARGVHNTGPDWRAPSLQRAADNARTLTATPAAAPRARADGVVAGWLALCAALVFAMVVLGGITRLTGSGLSMVEWDPIFGIVPPLSESEWAEVFAKYQASPEYRLVNRGMDLEGFKRIYYVEYAHRVLGRAVGVVFLLPLLWFVATGRVDRPLAWKLGGLFVLGGLQGLLGWYMVQSGLVDVPRVSPYRLTAHLGLAVLIYSLMIWTVLGLRWPRPALASDTPRLRVAATLATLLAFVTLLSGGFVAGTKAGYAFNTFPLMAGRWIPEGYWALEPWWRNLFENIAAVQFNHRLLALTTLAAVVALWLAAMRAPLAPRGRRLAHAALVMALVQVGLGISTLLSHVALPLASAHQAGAIVLLTLLLALRHGLRAARAGHPPRGR